MELIFKKRIRVLAPVKELRKIILFVHMLLMECPVVYHGYISLVYIYIVIDVLCS